MAVDDRFYVKTLRMQNFRCFEDVELGPFDPHFNLLVGENGAGKSSVLAAIAHLFGNMVPMSLGVKPVSFTNYDDVRVHYREVDEKWEGPTRIFPSNISGVVYYCEIDHSVGLSLDGLGIGEPGVYPARRLHFPGNKAIPISVYYGARRRFVAESESEVTLNTSPKQILALFNWADADASAMLINGWLKDQTLVALQGQARPGDAKAELGAVRAQRQINLLNLAVPLVSNEIKGIEYDGLRQGIVVTDMRGDRRDYFSMSDGQRALIGLVADLVRRMNVLNGELLGAETLFDTPGLVLIDEIDLHLHPKWQRQIVPALKKVFPKIQFFATTHSPQVIGECQPHEIVLLTPQGQKRPGPSGSYGRDSNWVLECIMGAEGRDPEVAKQLRSIWDAVEKGHFRKARAQIKKLRKETGDDPEIIGIESYMWRVEHGGDEAAE